MLVSSKKAMEILSDIETIDNGGCGYAAYFLYHIIKQETKDVKIVFCHRNHDTEYYQQNERFKKGESDWATSCSHVVLKIGNVMFDCNGVRENMIYEAYQEVTIEHLISSIKNEGAWNRAFNREKLVPYLEKKLGIKFGFINYMLPLNIRVLRHIFYPSFKYYICIN